MENKEITETILPKIKAVIDEIKKTVIGKDDVIIKMIIAIIANGHVLIEDIPGVGKTTLALAVSNVLSLNFRRIQFTPDVMPSDVTGFNVYNKRTGVFDFYNGAVFTNILLADELNRSSGKTQSALLEAMEEGSVTVDGVTRDLPQPFIVIATQNPTGTVGTALLPESEMDRFMIRLSMGYPDKDSEKEMLRRKATSLMTETRPVITIENLLFIREKVRGITIDDKILAYIADLAQATRASESLVSGISPRGSIALMSLSRAVALLRGRSFVLPEDICFIWQEAESHRVTLTQAAKMAGETVHGVLNAILAATPAPKL